MPPSLMPLISSLPSIIVGSLVLHCLTSVLQHLKSSCQGIYIIDPDFHCTRRKHWALFDPRLHATMGLNCDIEVKYIFWTSNLPSCVISPNSSKNEGLTCIKFEAIRKGEKMVKLVKTKITAFFEGNTYELRIVKAFANGGTSFRYIGYAYGPEPEA